MVDDGQKEWLIMVGWSVFKKCTTPVLDDVTCLFRMLLDPTLSIADEGFDLRCHLVAMKRNKSFENV